MDSRGHGRSSFDRHADLLRADGHRRPGADGSPRDRQGRHRRLERRRHHRPGAGDQPPGAAEQGRRLRREFRPDRGAARHRAERLLQRLHRSGRQRSTSSSRRHRERWDAFLANISHMWATEPNYTEEQLQSITTPILILDGAKEEAIDLNQTKLMALLIPRRGTRDHAGHRPLRPLRATGGVQPNHAGLPWRVSRPPMG